MPKNKDASARYRIIDKELRKGRSVKTSRLAKICSEQLGKEVSPRTIQKDIQDLKEDTNLGYYAPIDYDKRKKEHFYPPNTDYVFPFIELDEEEINALIFYLKALNHYKNYSIFNDISHSIEKVLEASNIPNHLKEKFKTSNILEAEKCIPVRGNELINTLIIALIENKKIEFDYEPFGKEIKRRKAIPYLLKEDKQMWYIIVQLDGKESPTTFALDRINNLKILEETFKPVIFNSEEYFKHSFGVTVSNDDPIKVVLLFNADQGNYIKSLPIHDTQEIITDDEKGLKISVIVKPSYEFYSKILGYGARVKIESPDEIVSEVKKRLKAALKLY